MNEPMTQQIHTECIVNDFLDSIVDQRIFGDRPVVQQFPDLEHLIEHYKTHISRLAAAYDPVFNLQSQISDTTIHLPYNNRYSLQWNVAKAYQFAHQMQIPCRRLPLQQLIFSMQNERIDLSHLPYALNNPEPIILARFLPSCRLLVIDGRHRLTAKFAHGEDTIPAYILPDYLHIEAMAADLHRALYKVHYNFDLLCSYACGESTLENTLLRMFSI